MEYKKQTVTRWTETTNSYNNTIQAELANEKRRIWTELLLDNAPQKENLRVLDVGTGPGFFSILLSAKGHQVTGIDCTPEMLEQAKNNARQEGTHPEFLLMDNHYLEFSDNTFDLVVSRNVTWTLYDPETAYAEWKRVLKPGGRLLIFDANWYMQHFDPEMEQKMRKGILQYREKYGRLPSKFALYRMEEYWKRLPLVGIKRPLWDRAMLWKLGFQDIVCDENISCLTALDDISQMLYGAATMFMVRATKVTQEKEDLQTITEYWDGQSPEQSIACLSELASPKREAYLKLLSPYLPTGQKMRVLDVGTGCGFLAILLAKEGHEVMGVDISPLMLEEAVYCANAHKAGVDFRLNNAEKLPFEDDYFDLIISRNLIWTLQNPETAISEWHRILKTGGILTYLDANFYLHLFDPQQKEQLEKFRQAAAVNESTLLYGTGHSSTSVMDSVAPRLPLSAQRRPEWDKEALSQAKFQVLAIEPCSSKLLGTEKEQIQGAATPMFFIAAQKTRKRDEETMLQKEMAEYWSQGSQNYDHIIQNELQSFRPDQWQKMILSQAPKKDSLDVLDVGCGPGFFSIILSQAGHRVTGVDCATGMLEKARHNAEFSGVFPTFLQLDCTELPFSEGSFDLVVSRNLTWTLSDPLTVYREWQRVLNPGGVLLIFDANWNLHYYDESLMEEVKRREKLCIEKYGATFDGDKRPTVSIDYDLLPLSSIKRPGWDIEQLTKLGFSEVDSVPDITDSLWDEKEKLLYGATPMFMVKAIRA